MLLHGTKKDQGRLKAARSLLAVNPATSAYNDRVDTVLPLPVENCGFFAWSESAGGEIHTSARVKQNLGLDPPSSPEWVRFGECASSRSVWTPCHRLCPDNGGSQKRVFLFEWWNPSPTEIDHNTTKSPRLCDSYGSRTKRGIERERTLPRPHPSMKPWFGKWFRGLLRRQRWNGKVLLLSIWKSYHAIVGIV